MQQGVFRLFSEGLTTKTRKGYFVKGLWTYVRHRPLGYMRVGPLALAQRLSVWYNIVGGFGGGLAVAVAVLG